MIILFKSGKKLEADICNTDNHQNLIIELVTEDYNSVHAILCDKEETAEIVADGNTFFDYTNNKYINTSLAEGGKIKVKAALTYGKDFTNALADVANKVGNLQTATTIMSEHVSDLEQRSEALEESQEEQNEAIEYLMTEEV